MTPETSTAFLRLGIALFAGLLIGLDRERAEQRKAREIFGGIRTFPLIALAGCTPMLIGGLTGTLLTVASFLAVAGVALMSYWRSTASGHIGATTELAAVATFLVGVMAGMGMLVVAGSAGITVAVLLTAKPSLEQISRAMSPQEVTAVLQLAVISGIILPILPNRGYGPWNVINPRDLWLVVVLVAALSFAGFVAMRLLGEKRGLMITGAVGGLVSSTAVTVAMADRSRDAEKLAEPAAAAAVLASSIMALRIAVFAGVINTGLLPQLLPACLAMAIAGALAARYIARADRSGVVEAGDRIRNPFNLRQAAVFALIYGAITLAVRAAQEYLGQGAMFAAAALGSIADVDAVTIAFTRLGPDESGWRWVAAAITLAAVINTLVKLGIAWVRGAGSFRKLSALGLGSMAVIGVAAGTAVFLMGA